MSALLAVLKCGCRRSLCCVCGKVVGKHAFDLQCLRHSGPLSALWQNGTTVSWHRECAQKPVWPPPHANWKRPDGG